MAAKFILSFDCEGKWGVADRLTRQHRSTLSNERLVDAYSSIVRLLDDYQIEATFAFVGAFSQSQSDFARIRSPIEELRKVAPEYLGAALSALDDGSTDGWHGDHLVDLVVSARTGHEVALHGLTHIPWTRLDAAAAAREMEIVGELQGPVRSSKTFVFPRNRIAHTRLLEKQGVVGFRNAVPERSRTRSLLSEFNIFQAAEAPLWLHGIIPIPAGFFLNWRKGMRRIVPPEVTRIRALRLLRTAAQHGAVVHFWLHPENIASSPATLELLQLLLRDVARARDSGDCLVLTQLGYCVAGGASRADASERALCQ